MSAGDRYLVVSADGHAGLPPEQYRDYLDSQYHEIFDQALSIQLNMSARMEGHFQIADINAEWRKGREQSLSGAWDHDERIRVMDADGIAAEVLFPDGITERNAPPFGAGFTMPTEGMVPDLQWAGCRAHNRWMAEFTSMAPERRIGLACVPALWDVDEAVKEVRWARENGLGGIILPFLWGSLPPYHHRRYDPLWAVCQDLEMPVHFHSGPAPMEEYFGKLSLDAPDESDDRPGAVGVYISEVCWWCARPVTFMLWGGAFERYPRLKAVITEGTTVWAPEYLRLLDQRYDVTHYAQKLGDYRSHLSMKPSEYFHRNVRLGASCMPRLEAEQRHETGLDCIMWGSDFPHPEGSWPFTRDQMLATFTELPDDEIATMLGGNAAKCYGLDVDALAPIVDRIGPEKSVFRPAA